MRAVRWGCAPCALQHAPECAAAGIAALLRAWCASRAAHGYRVGPHAFAARDVATAAVAAVAAACDDDVGAEAAFQRGGAMPPVAMRTMGRALPAMRRGRRTRVQETGANTGAARRRGRRREHALRGVHFCTAPCCIFSCKCVAGCRRLGSVAIPPVVVSSTAMPREVKANGTGCQAPHTGSSDQGL